MTVRASLGHLFVRNWPIKLAALFFAIMLYVAVAAQQPLSQSFAMRLAIGIPPGRTVRQQTAGVTVVITGKGSEILKLRSFPRVIRKVIPDTFSAALWRIQLQAADVDLPKGIDVQVADIRPRDVEILLDSVSRKDVRIVPRVKVEAESGYVLRGLSITPSLARVVGPEKSLAKLDSVTTLPTVISSVSGPFFQTVPIDTTPLGVVRISPKTVRMAGEVTAIIERSIGGVPITTAASGFTGFLLSPERVSVTVRGPASRVNTLTRDSVRVVAHLIGKAGPGGYARLTVSGPPRPRGARRTRLRVPQAEGRAWLTSFWESRRPATKRRPRSSWASADAPSSPASSSSRRTCTRCSVAWCRSSPAGRTCPPCRRWWTARSPRRDSPGAPWTRGRGRRGPAPSARRSWGAGLPKPPRTRGAGGRAAGVTMRGPRVRPPWGVRSAPRPSSP